MANIFKGSKLLWFPVLNSIMGDDVDPGLFTKLKPAELRLYLLLTFKAANTADRKGSRKVELKNAYLKKFANLDNDSLPSSRKALQNTHMLIHFTKVDQQTYSYEITDPATGWSMLTAADEDAEMLGPQ